MRNITVVTYSCALICQKISMVSFIEIKPIVNHLIAIWIEKINKYKTSWTKIKDQSIIDWNVN